MEKVQKIINTMTVLQGTALSQGKGFKKTYESVIFSARFPQCFL